MDALRIVADAIESCQKETDLGLIVVSHYARFLDYLRPTNAHILVDGRIVMSGGPELIEKVDREGYDWIEKETGVKAAREEKTRPISLGTCGARKDK